MMTNAQKSSSDWAEIPVRRAALLSAIYSTENAMYRRRRIRRIRRAIVMLAALAIAAGLLCC